jgi:hypothetical protein
VIRTVGRRVRPHRRDGEHERQHLLGREPGGHESLLLSRPNGLDLGGPVHPAGTLQPVPRGEPVELRMLVLPVVQPGGVAGQVGGGELHDGRVHHLGPHGVEELFLAAVVGVGETGTAPGDAGDAFHPRAVDPVGRELHERGLQQPAAGLFPMAAGHGGQVMAKGRTP